MDRRLGFGLLLSCGILAVALGPVAGLLLTDSGQQAAGLQGEAPALLAGVTDDRGGTEPVIVTVADTATADTTARVQHAVGYWTGETGTRRPVLATDLPAPAALEPWLPGAAVAPDVLVRVADDRLDCGLASAGTGPVSRCVESAADGPGVATISPGLTEASAQAATTAALGRLLGQETRLDGTAFAGPEFADPWPAQEPVTVHVVNEAAPDRDVEPLVAETLRWWEQADDAHGNYTTDWELVDDPDADVTVSLVVAVADCGDHENPTSLLGCGPVLDGETLADGDEHVRVRSGFSDATTLLILKHEFGHLYGRSHGMSPDPVMAARLPTTRRAAANTTQPALASDPATAAIAD
jgi:hypothetical protein